MEGNGIADWLFSEGNVQLGLVASVELLDGDGVNIGGGDMQPTLKLNIKISNIRAAKICLIFFSILPGGYYKAV
jgi:hypothetical protein